VSASDDTEGAIWRLPATPEAPAAARRAVVETVPGFARLDDLLLVASEAVTNAVSHGSGPDDVIDLRLHVGGGAVSIEVVQYGRNFAFDRAVEPTGGGWGLPIIEMLVDEWGVHQETQTATVWFRMS
jgi:anti-sigma regulatory factor (Ser/Thr protein kinase)